MSVAKFVPSREFMFGQYGGWCELPTLFLDSTKLIEGTKIFSGFADLSSISSDFSRREKKAQFLSPSVHVNRSSCCVVTGNKVSSVVANFFAN